VEVRRNREAVKKLILPQTSAEKTPQRDHSPRIPAIWHFFTPAQ
jgi:hypothetical protein